MGIWDSNPELQEDPPDLQACRPMIDEALQQNRNERRAAHQEVKAGKTCLSAEAPEVKIHQEELEERKKADILSPPTSKKNSSHVDA